MVELTVDLGDRSYPIFIGADIFSVSDCFTPYIRGKSIAIVTNDHVAHLYLESIKQTLIDYDVMVIKLPDGEKYKNLATLNLIFDQLLQEQQTRKTTLLALGGGVIGDMTGFAASCYKRGVDFIQLPTTLLAQVDSSVGGKTGINHVLGKNMIGSFYQPRAVVIDTDTLNTLSNREFVAGLAEVIKYGLICDEPFYQWLQKNIVRLLDRDSEVLSYAIHKSCQAKITVVEQDETELGVRAILNFGHTFGHAIESVTGYGSWLHGEAVAVGMLMATDLSCREGYLSMDVVDQLEDLLNRVDLPVKPPADINPDRFVEVMAGDKKVLDGKLRLVLLENIGKAVVTDAFNRKHLMECLSSFCS